MARLILSVLIGPLWAAAATAAAAPQDRPPNIVIVFADDLGYADIGCFGAKGYATPNIDRMAREGIRLTSFYAAQAVCSASRAALLTGCYPNRIGIRGALGPADKHGIHDQETTLAEVLKSRGYATAIFGKWHLGHHPRFLPTRHGFDEYFGLPYSNDMWPKHPTNRTFPELPLIEGESVKELNPDQRQLTTWYTEHAVAFIEKNRDRPFFLYVPHAMPHVPLFVSDKFEGKTERGLFGDVIAEIDWSVGQVLEALRRNGIDDRTLVIFTSDNGPWLSYGNHAGSTGPLREGKGTTFEGGVREPFVARWPGHVPAGAESNEPIMTIDLLPTLARLAGARAGSSERPIDGMDASDVLLGKPGAKSPHEALYFYWGDGLEAVRSGKWKLHFPHAYRSVPRPGANGLPGAQETKSIGLALFDLDADIGETTNLAEQNPAVVQRLERLAESARADLGDRLTGRVGTGTREPGRLMPRRDGP